MKNLLVIVAIVLFGVGAAYAIRNRETIQKSIGTPEEVIQSGEKLEITAESVSAALEEYLPKRIIIPDADSRVFCAQHLYGFEENKNSQIISYTWVYCEEYFLKDDKVTMGQGVSFPIKVYLKLQNNKLTAISHEEPVDGHDYGSSIRKMFPENFALDAVNGFDIEKFSPSPEEMAHTYYGK